MFEFRRKHTEADGEHRPGDDDELAMRVCPSTQPGQGRMFGVGLQVIVTM